MSDVTDGAGTRTTATSKSPIVQMYDFATAKKVLELLQDRTGQYIAPAAMESLVLATAMMVSHGGMNTQAAGVDMGPGLSITPPSK